MRRTIFGLRRSLLCGAGGSSCGARGAVRILAAALTLSACGEKPRAESAALGPIHRGVSDASARTSVSITVYNQNVGLVREVRVVALKEGRVELAFRDVAANIKPETVHIRSLDAPAALTVLEQNYRYDLLTPQTLLEKYVGKAVRVYRYNEATGKDEGRAAELLAVNEGGAVIKLDGEVTANLDGRFAFDQVPENLVDKPTLVWVLESKEPTERVEVTYLTQNLNWVADYVLVLDSEDKRGDITGWVTLSNSSGASYKNAKLKLVAGNVQLVEDRPPAPRMLPGDYPRGGAPPEFKQETLFEYHLYALQRPTNVLDKEQKQVALLEGHAIAVQKQLVLSGQPHFYQSQFGQIESGKKLSAYLEIQNAESNHLGMPLPAGTVRVYKADSSGAQQFIGSDRIDHTPRDEKLRIKLGEAFDVVADRRQQEFRVLGQCQSESSWEIELKNHKETNEVVEVQEPTSGDWELLASSLPGKRKDAQTLVFEVPVAARSKTLLSYRIRVRWC